MARHPSRRKRLTKEQRAERDARNELRGRTKAYLAAKAWAEDQKRKAQRRKLRDH